VIRRAASDLGQIGAEIWNEAKKAIPKGVGKGVEKGTIGLVVGGFATLAALLGGPLAGLAVLTASFRPLSNKADEIAQRLGEDAVNEHTGNDAADRVGPV
jgi:hypothetical protein